MQLTFDTLDELEAFIAFVQGTHTQGDTIMGLLEDLKAAQAATGVALGAISANVGDLKTGVSGLAAEIAALIALIGQSTGVPQDVVDAAKALQTSAEALVTDSQAVEDQIAAIPAPPAQG